VIAAVEINGKTYTTCCEMCKRKVQKEPRKYTQAKDSVSGQKVDKAGAFIYEVDGKAYYFASEASRKTFAEDPGRFLKK
jgi:YHS domain-containing protein